MNTFFWGAGFYYGIKTPSAWNYENKSDYGIFNGKVDSEDCKNLLGLYLELGFAIPVAEMVTLDLSGKFKLGLTPAIKDNVAAELKSSALLFTAGVSFKF